MIYILIAIIVLMFIPALVGLDEMIQSWRIAKWYEKRDRGQQIIKKLKKETTGSIH